jgi:hypothetical protein
VFAVFFPLINRYGFPQRGFKFFKPLLNRLPHRPGIRAFKQIHLYKPGLALYRYQYR